MREGLAGAVVTVLTLAGGVDLRAQSASRALRPEHAAIRALIANGVERSETFRDLIARLEPTDVVIYVRFSPCSGAVPACLQWASSAAGVRRLLIKVDKFGGSPDSLTALLAHELQHACEVASDPGVTDLRSFDQAFAARGWKASAGFETQQAKDVTRKVLMELTAPSGPRRRAR